MKQFKQTLYARLRAARFIALAGCAIGVTAFCQPAAAKTWCVNPSGSGGCFASISAAVAASAAGDIIQVAHGTYREDVVIPKPLSLVGENQQNTTIDATGLPHGIDIDGFGHPGLSNVVVTGFTVANANFAGILVTNASSVTIANNNIVNNDLSLVGSANGPTCPGLPAQFQRGEDLDCGEGIMFSGVDHSVIANNSVTDNAGGLLITDDTGATHDNLISSNSVVRNTRFDCGITLPSHSGAGVYRNTVSGNESSYNAGSGVGIFAPGPGSKAYGNVVVNNRIRGNGLPGVTLHNHAAPGVGPVPAGAPPVNFNNNMIVGNTISANAADDEDAATSGPTGINVYSVAPMSGTVIAQNTIYQEDIDIAFKIPAIAGASPQAEIHLNNFPANAIGIQNLGAAKLDATLNWWGCSGGPGANGCATVSGDVLVAPWLSAPSQAQ